ncbi:hypothetical protein [Novosphingobium sp. TH158]|uniref:hypothetical protein n=1 Tax=Novosphingobium sp. TH158 TaxID=2067455 RepID=UPI00118195E8|nr:hypothetical protein [Novosphingobium sp. TH158]
MSERGSGKMRATALLLSASLASLSAVPAKAQEQRASARGLVEITRSVGTGIAYDVLTDALSGAFLEGQVGDSVSLLVSPARPGTKRRSNRIPGEVVVLSAATYSFGVPGESSTANPPALPDSGGARRQPAGFGTAPGNLLFLAQFN